MKKLLLSIFFLSTLQPAGAVEEYVRVFNGGIYEISGPLSETLERVRSESFTHQCKDVEKTSRVVGALAACRADQYGDISRIDILYKPYLFDQRFWAVQNNTDAQEAAYRTEYYKNAAALVRDTARYVLKKRNPDISEKEESYFIMAILAKVTQEALLHHYRTRFTPINGVHSPMLLVGDKRDGKYRARGMMQINVAANAHKLPLDVDFDLVKNLAYGINFAYQLWTKADETSCVKPWKERTLGTPNESHYWRARAQVMYSGFNGGQGKMCKRLAQVVNQWGLDRILVSPNPDEVESCPSAKKDKSRAAVLCRNYQGYIKKYRSITENANWAERTSWKTSEPVKTPIKEILQGNDMESFRLAVGGGDAGTTFLEQSYRVFFMENGEACRINPKEQRLDCVQDYSNVPCFNSKDSGLKYGFLAQSDRHNAMFDVYYPGKNELCVDNAKKLAAVGSFVRITLPWKSKTEKGSLSFRTGPGMEFPRVKGKNYVKSDDVVQVLDFIILQNGKRYYKAKAGGKVGVFYAGKSPDPEAGKDYFGRWATPIEQYKISREEMDAIDLGIPLRGMEVQVINESGLPYFNKTGMDTGLAIEDIASESAGRFSENDVIKVEDVTVRGQSQEIYIVFKKESGELHELYAGQAGGDSTIVDNIRIIREQQ